ncbi:hypothetical protein M0R45_036534 [Rubus argutus]|uniref:C2H2-type domain-containing protein n=1 Tax=Rubus argutus TaxID=59490 RepID=A0AAW1W1I3_RUBAR
MESEISDVPEELELDERSIVCLDCELLMVLPDEKAKRYHDEIEHPWKCAAVVPEPIEAVVPEPIVAVVQEARPVVQEVRRRPCLNCHKTFASVVDVERHQSSHRIRYYRVCGV